MFSVACSMLFYFFYVMVQFSVLLSSSVLLHCSLLFIFLCFSSCYVCLFACIYRTVFCLSTYLYWFVVILLSCVVLISCRCFAVS
jgi:hypothetical protein